MNARMVGLVVLLIVGVSTGVGLAQVFWRTELGASVTVVSSPYATTLYSDAECLVPITSLNLGELMQTQEGVATSEWVNVYLQLDVVPVNIIYIHISTTGTLPEGAVIEGQKWRYLTSVYSDLDLNDATCDGSVGSTNPLVNGKPVEEFRFRIAMPASETGAFNGFGLEFMVTDSTNN